MKPYPKYKPSDIQWLGDIPEHWEVKKLKYVVNFFNNIRVPLSSEERGKMAERVFDYYGASGIIDKVENYLFDGKYILIGEDGANLLTRNTALAFIAEGQFWVNNHAHIIKPKDGNIIFFENLLENFDYTTFVTGSAQPKLTLDNLQNISIPIPPLPEQTAIAQFLDQKTAQIDTLIAQKQRLITLLKEERMAFINEILSDESFPLKKLKYVAEMTSGFAFSSDDFVPEGIQLIKISGLYQNQLSLERQPTFLPTDFLEKYENWVITKGDILMSMTGTLGKRDYGFAILLEEEDKYFLNQRVSKLNFNSNKMDTKFGLFTLRAEYYQEQLFQLPSGTKQGNLSNEQVLSISVPVPPLKTQQRIVESIETTTGKIDATLAKIMQEIELLKEYRVALISEVVTGKVSVV